MRKMENLGLHDGLLIAGFAGGVCYVCAQQEKPDVRTIITSLIMGTIAANYVSQVASHYVGDGVPILCVAWGIGVGAKWVIRAVDNYVRKLNRSKDG